MHKALISQFRDTYIRYYQELKKKTQTVEIDLCTKRDSNKKNKSNLPNLELLGAHSLAGSTNSLQEKALKEDDSQQNSTENLDTQTKTETKMNEKNKKKGSRNIMSSICLVIMGYFYGFIGFWLSMVKIIQFAMHKEPQTIFQVSNLSKNKRVAFVSDCVSLALVDQERKKLKTSFNNYICACICEGMQRLPVFLNVV